MKRGQVPCDEVGQSPFPARTGLRPKPGKSGAIRRSGAGGTAALTPAPLPGRHAGRPGEARFELPGPHRVVQREAVDQQQRQAAPAVVAPEFSPVDLQPLHFFFFSSSFLRKSSRARRIRPEWGSSFGGLGLVLDGVRQVALAGVDVGQGVVEAGRLRLQLQRLLRIAEGLVHVPLGVADQPGIVVVALGVLGVVGNHLVERNGGLLDRHRRSWRGIRASGRGAGSRRSARRCPRRWPPAPCRDTRARWAASCGPASGRRSSSRRGERTSLGFSPPNSASLTLPASMAWTSFSSVAAASRSCPWSWSMAASLLQAVTVNSFGSAAALGDDVLELPPRPGELAAALELFGRAEMVQQRPLLFAGHQPQRAGGGFFRPVLLALLGIGFGQHVEQAGLGGEAAGKPRGQLVHGLPRLLLDQPIEQLGQRFRVAALQLDQPADGGQGLVGHARASSTRPPGSGSGR